MALEPALAARNVMILETTGRRSGEPRQIEIWFAADALRDRLYLLAGGRDQAQWVRNIRASPAVRVRIGGQWFAGKAAEVEGGPGELEARRLVGGKYGHWREGTQLTGWARDSLPIAIDLDPA